MKLRTGIDLVEVNRLSSLRSSVRERFLKRVFTPREISEAGDSDASLSGRFAVKEAVMKALGIGIGSVSWQDIEVQRIEGGEPRLSLSGKASELARQQDLTTWSISISHTDTHAIAIAVALSDRHTDENSGDQ